LTGDERRIAVEPEPVPDALPLDRAPAAPASTGSLDWLVGSSGFGGLSLRPANLPATFPGPYSPLVIQPPDVGRAIQASFSGNE
jgi:hypothetical protein